MSTIPARMIAAPTALFFCTVALAYVGWTTQANALSEVYSDSVVPLRNLKAISDRYAVDVSPRSTPSAVWCRPLKHVIQTMDNLAKSTVGSSDLGTNRLQRLADIEVSGVERKDELGDMARTLLTFKEASIERQHLRLEAEADQQTRQQRAIQVEMLVADFESS